MTEQDLLKYITLTDNSVIIDRKFYEEVVEKCMANALEYKKQFENLREIIDKAVAYNYIVSNSDYVYSQYEIANKNISILTGVEKQ